MKTLLVLLLLCVAAVAALAEGVRNSVASSSVAQATPVVPIAYGPVRANRGEPTSAATAAAQVAPLVSDTVLSARVGSAPAEAQPQQAPWFYATVKAPGVSEGSDIEALWKADLLQGAVAEMSGSSADLRDDLGGSTLTVALPDGSMSDGLGGMGDVARGQRFANQDATLGDIREALTDVALQYGLRIDSLEVYRLIGAAPALVASTKSETKTASQMNALIHGLFGAAPKYEGYYLELRDANGKPFVRLSASFRTGAGRLWIDPQIAQLAGLPEPG